MGAVLGEGGFGITYTALDTALDMRVAVKEYYPNGFVSRIGSVSTNVTENSNEDQAEFFRKGKIRFMQEAQVLAKFTGIRGIVDVRDFFEENNTAYIVMEYLEGVTLKQFLKEHGRITPEQTLQFLTPVMESLSLLHRENVIHRDISPDNIMLTGESRNEIKLLDFGAARSVGTDQKSLSVMLKPGYAPEEQYRSKGRQGPWTDVYALCSTMYRCITGIRPDESPDRLDNDTLKAPSELGIRIDPQMESALMKGLAIKAVDRWQTVDELMRNLTDQAPKKPADPSNPSVREDPDSTVTKTAFHVQQTATPQTTARSAPANTVPSPSQATAPVPKKKKPVMIIVASILFFVLISCGILFLFVNREHKTNNTDNNDQTDSGVIAKTTQHTEQQHADPHNSEPIRLVTTTAVNDSGLLPYLLPTFEAETGYTVEVASGGSGIAFGYAKSGDADLLLVHSQKQEEAFIDEGYASTERISFMYDYCLIAGPADDPARIRDLGTAADCFKAISETGTAFVSRGDASVINNKELSVWESSGINPAGESWYSSVGSGMGDTLVKANETKAYTLTDKATYLSMKESLPNLTVLIGEAEDLKNTYSLLGVNADADAFAGTGVSINTEGAQAFIDWLLSDEAGDLIAKYGVEEYGDQLFFLLNR